MQIEIRKDSKACESLPDYSIVSTRAKSHGGSA